ncbi:RloB family protein [Glutamicibacter ardleyensis]|uniref:RloB family protein n=1 Tax=Glutamicibacter ardleyensis TaxID=225894 RepID=UPI003FD57ACE
MRQPFNTTRTGKARTAKTTILLVTNGKNTEAEYIAELSKIANQTQGLSVKKQFINGEPKSVLKKLCSPMGDTSGYDEIWILVDEDGHDRVPFIQDCLDQTTNSQKWYPVVSAPCFEVWLVAHYERVRNYTHQTDAQGHFRKLISDSTPSKSLPQDFPFPEMNKAIDRCQLNGVTLHSINELPSRPGTSMPHLIKRLNLGDLH